MRYKAKQFKSYKRKMINGKFEFFNIINKPSTFSMLRTMNKRRKKMSDVSVLGNSIITKVKSLDGCNDSSLVKKSFEICNNVLELCNDCYDEFEVLYENLDIKKLNKKRNKKREN